MSARHFAPLAALVALTACSSREPPAGSVDASSSDGAQPLTGILAQGAEFVQQRKCPDCHQSADPNDGVLTGQSAQRPGTLAYGTNLTPDPDTGVDGWDDATILRALRTGVDDQGAPLCPPMPRFPDMGDDEGKAIAAYLRSLPPVHRAIPASRCPPIKPAPDAGVDAGVDARADAPTDAPSDG